MALPGGPGTLTEIALMWNLMIVESRHRSPLILVGRGWQSTFDQFFKEFSTYISLPQREILLFAENVKTAVDMLEHWQP
jgi:predicted Rossmann-fold nucleotide-binding protein